MWFRYKRFHQIANSETFTTDGIAKGGFTIRHLHRAAERRYRIFELELTSAWLMLPKRVNMATTQNPSHRRCFGCNRRCLAKTRAVPAAVLLFNTGRRFISLRCPALERATPSGAGNLYCVSRLSLIPATTIRFRRPTFVYDSHTKKWSQANPAAAVDLKVHSQSPGFRAYWDQKRKRAPHPGTGPFPSGH